MAVMRRVMWQMGEVVLISVVLVSLLAGMRYGGRVRDWIVGDPGADERLITAIGMGDEIAIDAALADGASTRGRDTLGTTALMMAAGVGNAQSVERLIGLGAEVNATDNWGTTPLMFAARLGRTENMRVLMRHGADAARRNAQGETARDLLRNREACLAIAGRGDGANGGA